MLDEALSEAERSGAPRKHRKALVEALIVESNITNPAGGDRDSEGPLQQRKSQGWKNPRNVRQATRQFLEAAAKADRGQSSGQLAQDVQRSAFPGKYDAQGGRAGALLRRYGPRAGGVSTETRTIPGQDRSGDRQALLQQYLATRHDPSSLLNLLTGLRSAQDTPSRTVTSGGGGASAGTDVYTSRANRINRQHPSYSWGGGHGSKPAKLGTPVDCSGAVSQVLGINPKVSGDLAKWGKPGRGKKVTIYANGKHVFMEINGKFFGTSGSNPGGGAGWIPRSQISPGYLKGFTARHPKGG